MVKRHAALFNAVCAMLLACNFGIAVAFAQKQPIVVKPRHSSVPKALRIPFTNPKEETVQNPLIDVQGGQVTDDTQSGILANRKTLLKTVLGASLLSAIFSQRQLLTHFFSQILLEGYKAALVSRPLRTNVLTGASLAVIGDKLAQMRDTEKSYDLRRASSFAAFDSCYRMFQHVAIPIIVNLGQGNALTSLVSMIPLVTMGSKSVAFCTAMERTLLYQFGLIPFFYYPVFFTFTGVMQGLTLTETFNRAKTSFFPCWKRNLMFWIPTQMVMFGLVDEKWQIPFVCVMGILWSLILSITAGKAKQSD